MTAAPFHVCSTTSLEFFMVIDRELLLHQRTNDLRLHFTLALCHLGGTS